MKALTLEERFLAYESVHGAACVPGEVEHVREDWRQIRLRDW